MIVMTNTILTLTLILILILIHTDRFVLHICYTNCVGRGHGRGHECHSPVLRDSGARVGKEVVRPASKHSTSEEEETTMFMLPQVVYKNSISKGRKHGSRLWSSEPSNHRPPKGDPKRGDPKISRY